MRRGRAVGRGRTRSDPMGSGCSILGTGCGPPDGYLLYYPSAPANLPGRTPTCGPHVRACPRCTPVARGRSEPAQRASKPPASRAPRGYRAGNARSRSRLGMRKAWHERLEREQDESARPGTYLVYTIFLAGILACVRKCSVYIYFLNANLAKFMRLICEFRLLFYPPCDASTARGPSAAGDHQARCNTVCVFASAS